MEEKLNKLYTECINELNSIGIDVKPELIGKIDIKFARRNSKRYGFVSCHCHFFKRIRG